MARTKQTLGYKKVGDRWIAPPQGSIGGKAPRSGIVPRMNPPSRYAPVGGKAPRSMYGGKKLPGAKKKAPRKRNRELSKCSKRGAVDCEKIPGCRKVTIKGKEHCRPIRAKKGQRAACDEKRLNKKTQEELKAYIEKYYGKKKRRAARVSVMNKTQMCAFIMDPNNLNENWKAKYDRQQNKPRGKLPVRVAKGKY